MGQATLQAVEVDGHKVAHDGTSRLWYDGVLVFPGPDTPIDCPLCGSPAMQTAIVVSAPGDVHTKWCKGVDCTNPDCAAHG